MARLSFLVLSMPWFVSLANGKKCSCSKSSVGGSGDGWTDSGSGSDWTDGGSGADCKTSGGTAPDGSVCHFPFVHDGTTYNICTDVDHDTPWCYTNQEKSSWGECPSTCGRHLLVQFEPDWAMGWTDGGSGDAWTADSQRACYKSCLEEQKALTAEANNKCGDGGGDGAGGGNDEDWKAKYDALSVKHAELQREFDDQHWWVWTCCTGLKTTTECQ